MAARKSASKEKFDIYATITDKIISVMESGTAPWAQPWEDSAAASGLPLSLSTKKPYRGINVLLLAIASMEGHYLSPWFGTYKKITELGGQIRKGEKSTLVTFWTSFDKESVVDGKKVTEKRFMLRYYNVFNAEQADWPEGKAPEFERDDRPEPERIESAEEIVAGYADGPRVSRRGNSAYYQPTQDSVVVPPASKFEDRSKFYSTLFHELAHSTGHESRLKREFGTTFGNDLYSKEELIAELTAAILCGVAGIASERTEQHSAAYLKHWIRVLKDDKKMLVAAAGKAQYAADRILGTTFATEAE